MSRLTWPSGSPAAGRLHAAVCQEAARLCTAAGLDVTPPQAAFYLYPDFAPWRDRLRARFGVATGADLAALLLDRYGAGTLPGSAFGESASCLRLRLATGLLYGDTDEQREQALAAPDPLRLPWISAALTRFGDDPGRSRRPGRPGRLSAGTTKSKFTGAGPPAAAPLLCCPGQRSHRVPPPLPGLMPGSSAARKGFCGRVQGLTGRIQALTGRMRGLTGRTHGSSAAMPGFLSRAWVLLGTPQDCMGPVWSR